MKELTVEAKTENIDIVTELVESQLTELDCSMRSLVQISVAIDELFGNIAHYAYKPGTGDVTVRIDVEEPRTAVITCIIRWRRKNRTSLFPRRKGKWAAWASFW